jgi:glutathione peroxidase
MIVNVASECGLTDKNYKDMVESYKRWRNDGLEILAFPCSQFHNQEPGTSQEICQTANKKYGAEFPIMEKIDVNGEHTHPIYAYLRTNSELAEPTSDSAELIPWNFAKFFVNRDGKVIKYFHPQADLDEVVSFTRAELEK